MKISDLIAKLEAFKAEHGDLPVFSKADWAEVNEVESGELDICIRGNDGEPTSFPAEYEKQPVVVLDN